MKFIPHSKRVRRLMPLALAVFLVTAWMLGWLAWWPRQWALQALERREYAEARNWAHRAAYLDGQSAETEWLLGRIDRKLGRTDEALRHLRIAASFGADPKLIRREELLLHAQTGALEGILVELDRLLIEHSEDGSEICEAYVNGLLINGRVDEAVLIIQQWQAAFPNDPQPDYLLGRIGEFQNRTNDAERHYRSAVVKNPRHAPSLFGLSRTLISANRWDEALGIYRQCLGLADRVAAQVGIARCLKFLGGEAEALQLLRDAAMQPRERFLEAQRLLGEPTEDDTLHLELGVLEANLGHTEAALAALRQAVEFNPKHRQARYQFAQVLNAAGRSDEAKGHFEWYLAMEKKIEERDRQHDLVERTPRDLDARVRLGALYLETDSNEAGLFWLRGVLAEDPRHRATHELLADYYEAQAAKDPSAGALARYHRQMAR